MKRNSREAIDERHFQKRETRLKRRKEKIERRK